MALPTPGDLVTLDFSWLGAPFVEVPGSSAVNTPTLDYSWRGAPFVTPLLAGVPAEEVGRGVLLRPWILRRTRFYPYYQFYPQDEAPPTSAGFLMFF